MYTKFTRIPLFRNFTAEEISSLFDQADYTADQAAAGDIIALKGALCHALILVASGTVRCETPPSTGDPVPVERLRGPGVIMPGLLYAHDNRFPMHWVAETSLETVSFPKKVWTEMMLECPKLLENFLGLISDTTKPLSDKVVYRTFKTIKGKFSRYLLDQAQATGADAFRLPLTQREMADLFGVTRPALARAIGEMSNEGSIYIERKEVKILFPEKLKQYIG